MKKTKICTIFISIFSIFIMSTASAACNYETQVKLATEAANVKVQYEAGWYGTGEFVESEEPNENGEYLTELEDPKVTINIFNITENLYITVTNKLTNEVNTFRMEDTKNGSISFVRNDIENIVEYEIKVFSNLKDCMNEELKTISLSTPKYNNFHNQYYCLDSNKYYCQEFITTELNMSEQQIWEEYEKINNKKPNTPNEEIIDFWDKYQWWIIGSAIGILVIGVATTAILIKRKRSRVI